MSFLTILTPSYNRGYILPKLYRSLTEQTDKDFEWLIVDDGSTDETEKVVEEFISERKLLIKYTKKENGGKHTALNVGIEQISSPFTMIVDSDDSLSRNAVESIRFYSSCLESYVVSRPLCGISFLRAFPDGNINGEKPKKNEIVSNFIDNRINNRDELADKAEVYKTDILKKFPFPIYGKERFLQENIVWIKIAFEYDMLFLNEPIYIGDYLADGLTHNVMKNKLQNPIGMYQNAALLLCEKFNLRNRIKGALLYDIYYKLAHGNMLKGARKSDYPIMTVSLSLFALIIYWYYKIKYRNYLQIRN